MPFEPDPPTSAGGHFVADDELKKKLTQFGRDNKPKPKPKETSLPANVAGYFAEPVLAAGSGMLAKPAGDLAGIAAMLSRMTRGKESPFSTDDPATVQRDVQSKLQYEPRTPAGQAATQYNPLAIIGKLVHALGGGARSMIEPPPDAAGPMAEVRRAAGRGAEEAIEQAPGLIGAKSRGLAPKVEDVSAGAARRWMNSALKPDLASRRTGKAAKAVDTMLEEGISVSKGGVEKMQGKIEALDERVSELVKNSPETIDKKAVASRLKEARETFIKQVNATDDLARLQKAGEDFINHPLLPKKSPARTEASAILDERGRPFTREIPASGTDRAPVALMQAIKSGTYRQLKERAYGELKSSDIEAQKTLARGIREEIESVIPEVRPLSQQESRLLNALSLTERRLMQSANKNLLGLGVLAMKKEQLAVWLADRSDLFKSLVSRMLYSGGKATGDAMRTPAGPVAGLAVNQAAQSQGITPPPSQQ